MQDFWRILCRILWRAAVGFRVQRVQTPTRVQLRENLLHNVILLMERLIVPLCRILLELVDLRDAVYYRLAGT